MMKLNEILKKYSVTLKEREIIPKLTKAEEDHIRSLIDHDIVSTEKRPDFFNLVYSQYITNRDKDIIATKCNHEIIYNGRSYISNPTYIYDCGKSIVNKYYTYPFCNSFTNFIKPLGVIFKLCFLCLLSLA